MIQGYVKLKKSAAAQDKFGNAALRIMKGNDAGDKMELLKLLLKHGYGLSLGTSGNTMFKLPKNASVPESSIGDYIKATSQGGHVDPNAGVSSRPPAAGEDTDDGSGDGGSVATATTDTRDKALKNSQTTIEQLKNDMLGMVQERRQLAKHMEDMKASFEQELERVSKQLHASEEEKQNIINQGREMKKLFEEAEDRIIQLEQHMTTQGNDADSDGFASATSSLDIEDEDPPANDDGPAEKKRSIWEMFGLTPAQESPSTSAQPDPAGVPTTTKNPPVNKEPVPTSASATAPLAAAVISPPQPTPDENESRLKDEQASKKQAQLGYNPSVNWYGQTTQWGKIIHELDSFSWGYGPEFKTSIDPWSLKQLEAIDPFL
jgi:hypothetical protein